MGLGVRVPREAPNNSIVLNWLRGWSDTPLDVSSNLTDTTKQCVTSFEGEVRNVTPVESGSTPE